MLNHLLDKIIEESEEIGNLHFFITINFYNEINEKDLDFENKLKNKREKLIEIINKNIEMWTFISINAEKNEKKNYHFHCFIGIRSILGYNNKITSNLKNLLRDQYELDSYVKESKNQLEAKKEIHYCFKNIEKEENNKFSSFYFILEWQEIVAELLDFLDNFNLTMDGEGCSQNEFDYLQGIKKIDEENNKNIILNLWNYYLLLNKYYLYNDNIYEKIKYYEISYEKKFKINYLYENFNKIIYYFTIKIPFQFKNFDFYDITTKYINQYESLIKTLLLVTNNKFKPNFNLLEFKDGIYNIKINKFIPKTKFLGLKNKEIHTIKNYKLTFKHLKTPKNWINNIKRTLSNNDEDINKLYLFIANIFHKNNYLFNKKKVLFIIGDSNTQKTTLIVKPLINYFGEENIGVITQGTNFNFQDIHDKIIVVIDEYEHNNKIQGLLLKWFEGSNIKSEQKYKTPELLKNIPTILISNNDIKTKNEKINEAFENRFIKLIFKYKLKPEEINEFIINDLKKEEASIIIHCNKMYFKSIINKRTRLEYKNFMNLIDFDQKSIGN